jgi:uncharacterized protein
VNELRISVVDAIGDVSAAAWDACANPPTDSTNNYRDLLCSARSQPQHDEAAAASIQKTQAEGYNPFISHDFLWSLERSQSVGGRTGWQAQHVLAKTSDDTLVAVAPCYLKSHSRGEYVFDRGWAEAYERAGGNYYPKLQVAVPFTPATRSAAGLSNCADCAARRASM